MPAFAKLEKCLRPLLPAVLAFFSASAVAALLLAAFGHSPVAAFVVLYQGALGDAYALSESLLKTVPLVFTGLAVALSFRAGIWNIGADGQFIAGALVATLFGVSFAWDTPWLLFPAMFAASFLAGAAWGAIAGWLRERRGVSEVITTIMLNLIAVQLLSYVVHGPLMEASGTYPQSERIAPAAMLARWLPPTRLHSGVFLAVAACGLIWVALFRLPWGLRVRAIGLNPGAAKYAGIPISRHIVLTLALSGGLAAVGGLVEVTGVTHRLYENISPGYGYTAIAVALLARLHPAGVLVAAFLFGTLETGTRALQRSLGVSPVLAELIQALVILFVVLFETRWFKEKVLKLWQANSDRIMRFANKRRAKFHPQSG